MSSHLIAHCVIFVGYVVAMMQVPPSFRALIKLRPITLITGAGFFVFCGLTHIALALDKSDADWVAVTDHAQAACIITFLWCLSQDLRSALIRLRRAYKRLFDEFGPEVGSRMVKVIKESLGGSDDR